MMHGNSNIKVAITNNPNGIHCVEIYYVGRDSSVGIGTRYGLDCPGIEYPVQSGPGAYTASYTMGTGCFPSVKRPGRGLNLHLAPRLKKK